MLDSVYSIAIPCLLATISPRVCSFWYDAWRSESDAEIRRRWCAWLLPGAGAPWVFACMVWMADAGGGRSMGVCALFRLSCSCRRWMAAADEEEEEGVLADGLRRARDESGNGKA